ncbi:hypothetical protein QZM71_15110 [Burkholderia multivorans]|nr:hypothetical protein [Burkholderia multivorans]MDN7951809.1 hypothetical protein [Burkholderia multivorans]
MIDQDKMRALAKCLRADADFAGERESGSFDLRYEAADAINLLLAEVEAAEQQQQSLTSLLAECRNVAYVEGYAENFLSAAVGSPDDVPAFVGQTVTELRTKLEAAEKDAERYRALREFGKDGVNMKPPVEHVHAMLYSHLAGTIPASRVITGDELDRAIDAALAQRQGEGS